MAIKVRMPSLSPTMTEGKLAKWHKKEGEMVAAGDLLAEIETDKATMELEAVDEGRLARIVVSGETAGVPVNKVIAVLLEEGEDESALQSALAEEEAAVPAAPPKPEAKPAPPPREAAPKPTPAEKPVPEPIAAAAPPARPAPAGEAPGSAAPAPAAPPKGRIPASPLARRMAKEAGLHLTLIQGSGPRGRIVKADVEAAIQKGVPPAAAPAAVEAPGFAPFVEVPLSLMRKAIAERMMESKRAAPHFYLTVDCEVDSLLDIRQEINSRSGGDAEEGGGLQLSVNDFVIRAAALALEQVPAANVSWTGDGLRQYQRADIAVAVAVRGGLVAPVIRDVGRKGLAAISNEMRELAARAREGKLAPEEYQGGTFTVSNLGMYGIKEFAAILNPPQACILAVGRAEQRPVVRRGELAVANVMTCTLSIDHRAVDGAIGAEFLAAFKRLIEYPPTMLL
jgi:pyruvate dehydrogenase E2 component (dihydrolipoamide acetyltransferase)